MKYNSGIEFQSKIMILILAKKFSKQNRIWLFAFCLFRFIWFRLTSVIMTVILPHHNFTVFSNQNLVHINLVSETLNLFLTVPSILEIAKWLIVMSGMMFHLTLRKWHRGTRTRNENEAQLVEQLRTRQLRIGWRRWVGARHIYTIHNFAVGFSARFDVCDVCFRSVESSGIFFSFSFVSLSPFFLHSSLPVRLF